MVISGEEVCCSVAFGFPCGDGVAFPGSRHLAKYCADSSTQCSLTFSIFASTCRWSTLDIL